jgi:hypothetical protein
MLPRPRPQISVLQKRLPSRRKAVTVCIGAICEDYIVTVSDTKLSTGYYSHELGSLKLHDIHYLWRAMFAGKVSQVQPLLSRLMGEVLSYGKDEPSVEDMADLCTRIYKEYAVQLAEESVLAPFGLSMKEFLASRDKLGDAIYERIWGDIARVQVGCDLLVCGYCGGHAHVFTVTNPTVEHPSFITYFDEPGFAAIGTGNMLAESTLYAFEQTRFSSLEDTIYQTTFAKFVAESASDIGETNFCACI